MSLPGIDRLETIDFEQLRQQPGLCLKLAQEICQKHHLSADCTRMTEGSQLVFSAAGRQIIKIFAPEDDDFCRTESLFLTQLYQRLPLQTPELVAAGYWGRYPYLIMEQLPGVSLRRVWGELSATEQADLTSQLGHAIHALHTLPIELFASLPFQWQPFIKHQQNALLRHHERYGLEPAWLAQLRGYLNTCSLDLDGPVRLGPLHTELMPEHIFVTKIGSRWTISGLIDFEPAMVGQVEYEFCAVGLFLTPGNKALFRLFLSAYGYQEPELTGDLSRRIMGLMLLHRYSNLNRFSKLLPDPRQFSQLHQLEQYWYAL